MNFVRRNVPILIIGFIVGIVFVAITIIGQSRDSETTLVEAITSTFSVSQRETSILEGPTPEYVSPNTNVAIIAPPEETGKTPTEVIYPLLEIEFTETGFNPAQSNVRTGQTIRWVNKTDHNIIIKELIPKYPAFALGITLSPEESFEQLLNVAKIWTYRELGSGLTGKLIILEGTL